MKAIKAFVCRPRSWWKRLGTYLCVGLVYALPIVTIPGFAAIYLKIEGVDGESVAKGHEKWIEVNSAQWGVGRAIGSPIGGTRDASPPSFSEFVFTKPTDKTTPFLFLQAAMGTGRQVDVHFTENIGGIEQIYYVLTLSDVLVSGFSQSSGGARPSESISLNYTKFKMTYTPFSSSGVKGTPISAEYDLTTQKGQ